MFMPAWKCVHTMQKMQRGYKMTKLLNHFVKYHLCYCRSFLFSNSEPLKFVVHVLVIGITHFYTDYGLVVLWVIKIWLEPKQGQTNLSPSPLSHTHIHTNIYTPQINFKASHNKGKFTLHRSDKQSHIKEKKTVQFVQLGKIVNVNKITQSSSDFFLWLQS